MGVSVPERENGQRDYRQNSSHSPSILLQAVWNDVSSARLDEKLLESVGRRQKGLSKKCVFPGNTSLGVCGLVDQTGGIQARSSSFAHDLRKIAVLVTDFESTCGSLFCTRTLLERRFK